MYSRVRLYSNKKGEIYKFLYKFYNIENSKSYKEIIRFSRTYSKVLEWENAYSNPVEIATILGVFIDNVDDYNINMWVCLDKGFFINITKNNANNIIKYLYERYPY